MDDCWGSDSAGFSWPSWYLTFYWPSIMQYSYSVKLAYESISWFKWTFHLNYYILK
jgi:hypothetical protein